LFLCDIGFLGQSDADFDAFLEAGFFVVTAEGADRVDDLVHFPEGLAIHGCIEVIEVLPDDLVIKSVELRQLLSRGKITFYSLIFMEWAMNCKVCVLWALW